MQTYCGVNTLNWSSGQTGPAGSQKEPGSTLVASLKKEPKIMQKHVEHVEQQLIWTAEVMGQPGGTSTEEECKK